MWLPCGFRHGKDRYINRTFDLVFANLLPLFPEIQFHRMSSRCTGSSSQSDVSKARKVPFRRCYCGLSAPFSTSWSDNNPGRRYFGCQYWPDEKEACGFFEWYDDEVSEWYKEVLNKLKPKKVLKKSREASVVNLVRVMIGLFVIFMIMVLVLLCLLLKG